MKIGLQTWGSDGDINPFIALAGGLAKAGHDVTLAITAAEKKEYHSYSQQLGFRLLPVSYIMDDDEQLIHLSKLMSFRTSFGQVKYLFEKIFAPNVSELYETAQVLCADHDLLIGHFLLHPLQLAAARSGKPYVTLRFVDFLIPSRYLPPYPNPNLGPWLNGLQWKLVLSQVNRLVLPSINQLRQQEHWILARDLSDAMESPLCNLIATSAAFCRKPPDWGDNFQVTGFLALPDSAHSWKMPDSLRDFLQAGEPPVFLTFGSNASILRNTQLITQTAQLLIDGAKASGYRAIVQARWDCVTQPDDDPRIYRIGAAPHSQIFPHCATVVHHGGAGTTHSASFCGKPQVVVAHMNDQYYWSHVLRRAGVTAKKLDRRTVTPQKIGLAIKEVLRDPKVAENAIALGKQLSAEDGVKRAVAIVNELCRDLEKNRN